MRLLTRSVVGAGLMLIGIPILMLVCGVCAAIVTVQWMFSKDPHATWWDEFHGMLDDMGFFL